jgi:hypothetical protein
MRLQLALLLPHTDSHLRSNAAAAQQPPKGE